MTRGGDRLFTGGIENGIKAYDLRKNALEMELHGHADSVTGMSVSPDGVWLLSNAMDNTLRTWDLRPFAPPERCTRVFQGHVHGFDKNLLRCAWSADGRHVSCGSADRFVNVWEVETRDIIFKLPGHKGTVNDVAFHPSAPVIASAGSDGRVYLGELEF